MQKAIKKYGSGLIRVKDNQFVNYIRMESQERVNTCVRLRSRIGM